MAEKNDDSSQAAENCEESQRDISPGLNEAILHETGVDLEALREEKSERERR